jgi:hypothetical protein
MIENFKQLGYGLPVDNLKTYLENNPDMWKLNTIRQDYPDSAHIDTETIFIRGPKEFTFEEYQGNLEAYNYDVPQELSHNVISILMRCQTVIDANELGYVLIVKLLAGGEVFPHCDEGRYAEYYNRYHIVIQSSEGNIFTVNDESVEMKEGELWTFNHRAPHHVINNSSEDRIHIIFDAK